MGNNSQHIKLGTADDFSVVWFDGASSYAQMGEPKEVDILGVVFENVYQKKHYLQIRVTDLRES